MTAWQMEHDAWQTGGRSQGLCHLPFLICQPDLDPIDDGPAWSDPPTPRPILFPPLQRRGRGGWGGLPNRKSKDPHSKILQ